jgi:hypothetical protein
MNDVRKEIGPRIEHESNADRIRVPSAFHPWLPPAVSAIYFSLVSFASVAPLRENRSSLRINFRKVCQSEPNRATHAVSPRKTGGTAEPGKVSNDAKSVQNSVKRVPKVPNVALRMRARTSPIARSLRPASLL